MAAAVLTAHGRRWNVGQERVRVGGRAQREQGGEWQGAGAAAARVSSRLSTQLGRLAGWLAGRANATTTAAAADPKSRGTTSQRC